MNPIKFTQQQKTRHFDCHIVAADAGGCQIDGLQRLHMTISSHSGDLIDLMHSVKAIYINWLMLIYLSAL